MTPARKKKPCLGKTELLQVEKKLWLSILFTHNLITIWTANWKSVYRLTHVLQFVHGPPLISSRIAGPGELFSSDFRACAWSPRWKTRCSFRLLKSVAAAMQQLDHRSASELFPLASSPLSEQRRTWLLFAEQIEIFQVKACQDTFKARNANLKFLDDRRKKKTARSTCGRRLRPPPSIIRRSSQRGRCRSLSKSVIFAFFKFVAF